MFLSPVLGRYTSLNPALWWWRQYYKADRDRILDHSVWGFIEARAQPLHSGDWVEVRSLSGGWMFYFSHLSTFTLISDSQFLLRPIRTLATLLFYHSRSQIILRKCFFQMTALFLWDPSGMDLTSETESEPELIYKGSDPVILQTGSVTPRVKRTYCPLIFM